MKKKQKLFLCFTVILITAIFTGCVTVPPKGTFPPEFIGMWERDDQSVYKNTLTITLETITASNQDYFWNASKISGDLYMISQSNNPSNRGTISLKLVDGNLVIVDAYDAKSVDSWIRTENDWSGTWKKKQENKS